MVLENIMSDYKLQKLDEKTQIRDFYYQDRPLTAYALGDLEDENWEISTFTGAFDGDTLAGVSLLWNGTSTPVFIVVGKPDAARALIKDAKLPNEIFYMMPAQLLDVLRTEYVAENPRMLWRMAVRPSDFKFGPPHQGLRRLTLDDAERVKGLFDNDPMRSDRISSEIIDAGVFYGIEGKNGEILAMAGTHIYAESEGIAVVGYVYTAPEARGRGLATSVAGAVTRDLINRGIDHVVLNVEQGNPAAVRSYQKLGFRIHAPIVDGVATRQKS